MNGTANMNNHKPKTVVILGAGNAGMFAAHILKKHRPALNIIVVGSKEVGYCWSW